MDFRNSSILKLKNRNMKINVKDIKKTGGKRYVCKIHSKNQHDILSPYFKDMYAFNKSCTHYLIDPINSGCGREDAYPKNYYNIIHFNDIIFDNKVLIGYKCPTNLYGGDIKEGEIYKICFNNNFYEPSSIKDTDSLILPKEIVETWEPVYKEEFSYEEGDYLYCIKDFIMGSGNIAYTKDKIYLSEKIGCITDNDSSKLHYMNLKIHGNNLSGMLSDYFRKATPEEIEKAKEQKVNINGINLTIKDNKVYHDKDNTDITNYIKAIETLWNSTLDQGDLILDKYVFNISDITIKQTGCRSEKSSIHDWLNVAKMLK